MLSLFLRDAEGVHRTYSTTARGVASWHPAIQLGYSKRYI
jgi:hypothetical protein